MQVIMKCCNTLARLLSELIQSNHEVIISCAIKSRILGTKYIPNLEYWLYFISQIPCE